MGEAVGLSEASVISRLARYQSLGLVSRIGVVFKPHSIGMSTLAAMAVPDQELEEVAALVNGYSAVNHNYEREHRYNLWFVAAGEDSNAVEGVLADIESRTRVPVLRLPLVRDFHIDLGFSLAPASSACEIRRRAQPLERDTKHTLSEEERQLVSALDPGLPLVSRPFREIALRAGTREVAVIRRLEHWLLLGVIRRVGIVVRHRELGYRANGMVVWDLHDSTVAEAGRQLATFPWVTLCYQRPRQRPSWPYNLFTMVHGKDRAAVLGQVERMASEAGVANIPRETLFSVRRFKQTGARYGAPVVRAMDSSPKNRGHCEIPAPSPTVPS